MTPEGIELLAASPQPLLRLGLSGCAGLGGSTLSFVAERAHELQHLDISNIPTATASVVADFFRHCFWLETIDISGLARVNRSSFHDLTRPRAPLIDEVYRQKRCVDRSQTGQGGRAALPHLRVARMLRLPNLDDASVVQFAAACPKLEELLLSDSSMVTGACLLPLSSFCSALKSLALDRCGAAGDELSLAVAIEGFPALEHLAIALDDHVQHTAPGRIHSSASHESILSPRAPFDGLCSVPASEVADRVPRGFLGSTFLTAAARCCNKLVTFGLEGHKNLTFAVEHAPPGAFPNLTEMRLTGCRSVDDAGLLVLLKACPRVRTLCLEGSQVSQEALMEASSAHSSFVNVLPPPPISITPSCRHRTARVGSPLSADGYQHQRVSVPGGRTKTSSFLVQSSTDTSPSASTPSWRSGSKPSTSNSSTIGSHVMLAAGLQPAQHCHLHLDALAILSRFEEERTALKKIVRAVRRYRNRMLEWRTMASRQIGRTLLAYFFKVKKSHADQVTLLFRAAPSFSLSA